MVVKTREEAEEQKRPKSPAKGKAEVNVTKGVFEAVRKIFGESFGDRCKRIRSRSPFGALSTWKLIQVIVKQGCDLRQEQFAMQLMSQFNQIFQGHKIPIWLLPYEIICTGYNSGLVQFATDTISLDSLHKKLKTLGIYTLNKFFELYYKTKQGNSWREEVDLSDAKYNFAASLAGYSLLCYVLQIKDRHNGNLLLDKQGHLIHIDFDFFLSNSPGNNFQFEQAPFKLTSDYIELMEGTGSEYFQHFRRLMVRGFVALQEEYKKIVVLTAMTLSVNQNLPCFVGKEKIISGLNARLFPHCRTKQLTPMSEKEASNFVDKYFLS